MTDRDIDDIALFFAKGGQTASCLISRRVYTDPANKLPATSVPTYWKQGSLLEEPVAGQAKPYFVVNLARLDDPGVSPLPLPAPPDDGTRAAPGPEDLVVIPWNDDNNAYVVPKATYEDPTKCPPLDPAIDADLIFLGLNEGVVLANVPKADLVGATCFVLNLLALRSYP